MHHFRHRPAPGLLQCHHVRGVISLCLAVLQVIVLQVMSWAKRTLCRVQAGGAMLLPCWFAGNSCGWLQSRCVWWGKVGHQWKDQAGRSLPLQNHRQLLCLAML